MKNLKTFNEFLNQSELNEGIANPKDVKSDARSAIKRKADIIEFDELDASGIKLLDKQHELFSKTLKTSDKELMMLDSESNAYELVQAIYFGFQKRRDEGDKNIQLVSTLTFQSPFAEKASPAYHYRILDAKIDLIALQDGDEFADFQIIVYSKRQEKDLISWANANLSDADLEY